MQISLILLILAFFPTVAAANQCDKISLVFYKFNEKINWGIKLTSPLPIYHVGVLICGKEYHYAQCLEHRPIPLDRISIFPVINSENVEDETMRTKGIMEYFRVEKKKEEEGKLIVKTLPLFIYIETVPLEGINVKIGHQNRKVVTQIVRKMADNEYDCWNYELLTHNCANFAKDFVIELVGNEEANKIKWPKKLKQTLSMAKFGQNLGNFLDSIPRSISKISSLKKNKKSVEKERK